MYSPIKPWQDIAPTEVPDINTVIPLLKDVPPTTPSVGQVKRATVTRLKSLCSHEKAGVTCYSAYCAKEAKT